MKPEKEASPRVEILGLELRRLNAAAETSLSELVTVTGQVARLLADHEVLRKNIAMIQDELALPSLTDAGPVDPKTHPERSPVSGPIVGQVSNANPAPAWPPVSEPTQQRETQRHPEVEAGQDTRGVARSPLREPDAGAVQSPGPDERHRETDPASTPQLSPRVESRDDSLPPLDEVLKRYWVVIAVSFALSLCGMTAAVITLFLR